MPNEWSGGHEDNKDRPKLQPVKGDGCWPFLTLIVIVGCAALVSAVGAVAYMAMR